MSSGCARVDSRAAPVRYAESTPDAVDQIPDCSHESVVAIPDRRSVAGEPAPVRSSRISSASAPLWRSIQPRTSLMLRPSSAAACSRVESSAPARSAQCWSPVRTACMRLAATIASAVTTAASPPRRGGQRRPPDALDSAWALHLSARVVKERPAVGLSRGRRRRHDVRFGRRGDDRPVEEQDIGYDQGRCLARAWRSEHESRALRAGPGPPLTARSDIDAVTRRAVRVAQSCDEKGECFEIGRSACLMFHTGHVWVWGTRNSVTHFASCTDDDPRDGSAREQDATHEHFARSTVLCTRNGRAQHEKSNAN